MIQKLFILTFFFLSSSSIAFTENNLSGSQLLCPTLLWGFEFISSNRVKVINTDLNKITTTTEYYYDVDLKLSFINIFANKNRIRDRVYSIELNSLRVDIWTMTGGGFTTREMFPNGLCEFVKIKNFLSYIESLK
tara:strand:+ start:676 stop:1080 length:405 start_codon:yes stop_codon:yes gene_type:complete